MMHDVAKHLEREGIPYSIRTRPAVDGKHLDAIRAWERLRNGGEIPHSSAQLIFDNLRGNMDIQRGCKILPEFPEFWSMQELQDNGLKINPDVPWFEAFQNSTTINIKKRQYYRRILSRGEEIKGKPRVTIQTIHGVKGGEADNVLVLDGMSWRTYQGFERNPDDEHRVFYVAATRARENLFIVRTHERNTYPMPTRC
jgi:hypothetical protein